MGLGRGLGLKTVYFEHMKISAKSLAIPLALLSIAGIVAIPKIQRWQRVREAEQLLEHPLPEVTHPLGISPNPSPSPNSNPQSEVNLPVPFTSQAPHANWGMPYQEACEEASVLMAFRYAFGNPILSPSDADAGIRDLVRINEETLGNPVDQTIAEVRDLMLEIEPTIVLRILKNPQLEELKAELSRGNVIIVPAEGRKLKNPFFQSPGPLYHMLVLRGYTSDGFFITNDPGTRRGEGYLYPFDRIMEAMHDWPIPEAFDMPVEPGGKVVLIVEPMKDIQH